MCQQAIEKIVKGLHVLYTGEESPKTHNILYVFNLLLNNDKFRNSVIDENFDVKKEEYKPFFIRLVSYYISERYPAYKNTISSVIDQEKAYKILNTSEEVFQWAKSLSKFKD